VKTYLAFKQMNVNAARGKVTQLNEEIKAASPDLAFTTEDETSFSEIYRLLSLPAVALPDTKASNVNEKWSTSGLLDVMCRWPEDKRFPIIDIARCLAAISPAFGATSTAPPALLQACDWSKPWTASKARETNTLLALRALANMFLTTNGRKTLSSELAGELLRSLKTGRRWSELGPRKMPLATIALNYSILAVNNAFPVAQTDVLLDLVLHILENETDDSETIYRATVALGNVLWSPSVSGSLQIGPIQKGKLLASERANKLDEKRLKDLAIEIGALVA